MSVIIREIYWQEYDTATQIRTVRADITCDAIADLPSGGIMTDYKLDIGSRAHVIADGSDWEIQSSGSWVRQPSRMQLDLTGYATTQDLADGLAAKVDTATYTSGQAEQDAEIAYSINTGAKNMMKITASSGVLNTAAIDISNDGTIHVTGQPTANGAYVISSGIELVIPENSYILSMGAEAGNTRMSLSLRRKGTTQYVDLYRAESRIIPAGTYDRAHIYLYADTVYDTYVYPMIRNAAITDNTYVPYAPTNRELYEMILALQ